jgi:hypothetical protein
MSAGKPSLQEASMAVRINSFREIAGRYDVVLCDVWGVLHNGIQAFASACEALAEARAQGLTVVLITNSPPAASGRHGADPRPRRPPTKPMTVSSLPGT